MNTPPVGQKKVPIRNLIDRKWWIAASFVVVIGGFAIYSVYTIDADEEEIAPAADIRGIRNSAPARDLIPDANNLEVPGAVKSMIEEGNERALAAAERRGESYISTPIYEPLTTPDPPTADTDKGKKEDKGPETPPRRPTRQPVMQPQMAQYLAARQAQWAGVSGHGTAVMHYESPLARNADKDEAAAPRPDGAPTAPLPPVPDEIKMMRPGDMLFISTDVAWPRR